MDKCYLYKISLKNREIVINRKMYEIISDLLGKLIPATYGYFFLQEIFLDCGKLLNYLDSCEKALGITKCEKLKQICENEKVGIISLGEIEEKIKLNAKDLATILIGQHPDCIQSCLAHVFLFTKNLLSIKGGRLVDPTRADGLYTDLKNAKKFYDLLSELRMWETSNLWKSVWEPLGGQPPEEELEKIPDEKIPFEIEEIRWEWGWDNINGYLIDIRDLRVHPNETLEELEKRIDKAIQPIKRYLSRRKPTVSDVSDLFPDIEIMSITIAPLRGKYRRTL